MEKLIKLAAAGLVLALLGYAFGRYMQPAKVEVRVEEKVKTVLVETSKKKKIKVKIIRPDGTIEEREVEEDVTITEKERVREVEKEKIITNAKPQWKAGVLAGLNTVHSKEFSYGVQVERRIIGPVFMGVWGTTTNNDDQSAGVSISLEF